MSPAVEMAMRRTTHERRLLRDRLEKLTEASARFRGHPESLIRRRMLDEAITDAEDALMRTEETWES